jgi:hypothetical protein
VRSPFISDSISASQIGAWPLVNRFSTIMASMKWPNVSPMKKPENPASAAKPAIRSTSTRRS